MQSPHEIILLRGRFTRTDFIQIAREYQGSYINLRLAFIFASAIFLYVLSRNSEVKFHLVWGFFAFLFFVVSLLIFFIVVITPLIQFKTIQKNSPSDLDIVYFFSDEEIRLQSNQANLKIEWDYFDEITEAPNTYFLLKGNCKLYRAVPKRFFEEKDQELAFRELVERHIGQITPHGAKKRKPNASA